ncbi:MAG: hypothetical protein ACTS3R_04745 [Inquilinaceae bacterium]
MAGIVATGRRGVNVESGVGGWARRRGLRHCAAPDIPVSRFRPACYHCA